MSVVVSGTEVKTTRLCLCCGASAATRSVPACWDHWTLLPEGLRSSIVTSYGRGQLSRYAESLLEAVKLWRQAGAWRSKRGETAPQTVESDTPAFLPSREERNVISFVERRPMIAARRRSGSAGETEQPATAVGSNARVRG